MDEDLLIRHNSLIHGHDPNIEVLDIDDKFLNLAVSLAINSDYEKTGFNVICKKPRLLLKDAKVFLNEKLILHKIPYTNDVLLKIFLNGRLIKKEEDLVKLYNGIGFNINPFCLPVKFTNDINYYGKLSLVGNISDDEYFLKNMKLFFKSIELGSIMSDMTSVCYIHEIMHTQIESLKGSVKDYYNSECLSIFMELVYSSYKSDVLLSEAIKNRINLYMFEVDRLFNYLKHENNDKWDAIISCKYIVSTLKAFNLFNKYYFANDDRKKYIFSLIQTVLDSKMTLEEMLEKLEISYSNSINYDNFSELIYRKK